MVTYNWFKGWLTAGNLLQKQHSPREIPAGTLWNILVAWLSARVAHTMRHMGQLHRWIDRALGALFIYIGIRLAVGERG